MAKRTAKRRPRSAIPAATTAPKTKPARKLTSFAALIGIPLVLGAVAYRNSFGVPLIFDDDTTVQLNAHIRTIAGFWQAAFGVPHSALSDRPIPALTFALNFHFGRLDVRGYHAVNLAIHLASGCMLWGLVRRTCLAPRINPAIGSSASWLATVVTTLWLLHPLQTEAVVYITQRTTLLMGFFMLATLYCSARSWTAAGRTSAMWQAMAVASCAAGMASKEDMIAAPILVLLYDATFFADGWLAAWRRRAALYACLFATWILLAAMIYVAPRNPTVGLGEKIRITPWEYLLTQARAIGRYLWLAFWPSPLILAYDWKKTTSLLTVWPQATLIAALLAGTIYGVVRRQWWGWLGACFFLILAPTSSVMPIATELIAERRMYLPLLAIVTPLVIAAAALLRRMSSGFATSFAALVTVGVLVLVYERATEARVIDYRDSLSIWTDTVAKAPDRPESQTNLANAYAEIGNLNAAIEHYQRAIQLNATNSDAFTNLGQIYRQIGRYDLALDMCRRAVTAAPQQTVLHVNLAMALIDLNMMEDALAEANIALGQGPNRADVQNVLGIILARQGRFAEAAVYFRRATELDPSDPRPHYNLGQMILEEHGNGAGSVAPEWIAQAIEQFRAGLAARGDDADGHQRLGRALAMLGDLRSAVAEFEIAARLRPSDQTIQDNIAKLRQAIGTGTTAVSQ
ncbi:MAG TPA: tetratricopeptide repeat protein [Pirellulales bacterium]|nr:tetratricopeptide repeat protein [Pirellulales bacterium]